MNRMLVFSILVLSVAAAPVAAHAAETSAPKDARRIAILTSEDSRRDPTEPKKIAAEPDYSHALSPAQMDAVYVAALNELFHIDHSS